MTGKQVSLNLTVDPAIMGGVMVKIGDRVIDGSIKGQLDALREKLLAKKHRCLRCFGISMPKRTKAVVATCHLLGEGLG